MAQDKTEPPNIFAYRGRHLLAEYNKLHKDVLPEIELSKLTSQLEYGHGFPPKPVCIIGAGAAGLYTAMILESLGVGYQIVEANTRERLGGRIFTYRFPDAGLYDYFDVGALRFQRTPFTKRFFDLVENRSLKSVKLIPSIKEAKNTWLLYNGVRVNKQESSSSEDPFNVKSSIEDKSLAPPKAASKKVKEVLQGFRDIFRPPPPGENSRSIAESIATVLEETNPYSMRVYMMLAQGIHPRDVSWCETVTSSTGKYDQGLSQLVLESVAGNWPTTPLPGPETPKKDENEGWWCIDGGSSVLAEAMFASLPWHAQASALFESPVTAISRDRHAMKISINGNECPHKYSAIISTIPLPRLALVDLSGANIHKNYTQWSAIRELQSGSALKIGIKFSTPWWETNPNLKIHGGQSSTDLPSRTIAYPSYPAEANPEDISKVLIVSFCKTSDAQRFSGLVHPDGKAEPELIDQVFRDLAAVHGLKVEDIKQYYKERDYFAWEWGNAPFTLSGDSFFSPGMCEDGGTFCAMLEPAARGKLFFAGETTSASHGLSGALDSAWRAVDQYLSASRQLLLQIKFHEEWGATEYWDETPENDFAEEYRKLLERHLVISFGKDGVIPEELGSV